jgi:polar amino acid transport system substrate-binding protein
MKLWKTVFVVALLAVLAGCSSREKITSVSQLAGGREFAVPTGTVADKLVTAKFPDAKFKYYNSALDGAIAVRAGKADALAYDEPILRNIAAKTPGLTVLPEPITTDDYGFAVRLEDTALKSAIDAVVAEAKANGDYQAMLDRWLPKSGSPAPMPTIEGGSDGELRLGTAAVTEPFSFVDGSQKVVGLDIEIAAKVARRLNRQLRVVNMEFGSMIPALIAGKVDLIGACITITPERAKQVLFSEPYYRGGMSALVRE